MSGMARERERKEQGKIYTGHHRMMTRRDDLLPLIKDGTESERKNKSGDRLKR